MNISNIRLQLAVFAGLLLVIVQACAAPVQTIQLPMTDGTKLTTDLYRPKGEGPFPVVLMRSTYGRAMPADAFLTEGYATVVQDVRGMGTSEGEKNVFFADGWRPGLTDGADTVAWIKQQPWCNGKIGTYGGSALALTQMLLAPATTDVSAQFILVGAPTFCQNFEYPGGVFQKNMIETWLTAIGQPHVIPQWKAHPAYDDFWRSFDTLAVVDRITAPALFVGGWYDIFTQGTIDAFTAREARGGEGARGRNLLVMTWAGHGADKDEEHFTADFGLKKNRTEFDVNKVQRAFFKAALQGDEHALDGIAKVNYYTIGDDTDPNAPGNEWRTSEVWPPYAVEPTPVFLRTDRRLTLEAPSEPVASLGFTFNPADPYPTHGGNNLVIPYGPYDQRKYSNDRKDLVKFFSDPLTQPVEVTGQIKVKLFVSTDAKDTDFAVKLLDVYPDPDGREINVVEGIQRVKFRKSIEKPEPLLGGPGEVVEITVDLWSTSWVFNTGHRVGLLVSSSNYPRWEVNPNNGDDFPSETNLTTAQNVVHMDAAHPSALLLPIKP